MAISTPAGRGAIGIVRLSGPDAQRIACVLLERARPLRPRHATFGVLHAREQRDHVVATAFPAPHSYTAEDVVEISAHGSQVVLLSVVQAAMDEGARLAEPGEFTLRAFVNGKIDLPQAEAVRDLIEAVTPAQARAAFDQLNGTFTTRVGAIDAVLFDLVARLEASVDFPDEGYHFVAPDAVAVALAGLLAQLDGLLSSAERGRLIREGVQIAIAGPTNAGKSSLFNSLVGSNRAIVTDVPGTTRDMLTEVVDLDGLRVTLVDTAGLRDAEQEVEREGIERARAVMRTANLVLVVCDGSVPLSATAEALLPLAGSKRGLLVSNKSDVSAVWHHADEIRVSARTGDGLDAMVRRIHTALDLAVTEEPPPVTNIRHIDLLRRARVSVSRARDTAMRGPSAAASEEFVLADLQEARSSLEEVVGRRTSDDLLRHVFDHFCVGK